MAALLAVGSGLATMAWGLHAGDKTSVLAATHAVAKGHVVQRSDLQSVSVSGVDDAIPLTELSTVVGQTATVDMVPGQLLTVPMLTGSPMPAAGQSVVGLALDPTRVPSAGLEAGDVVDVIAVPAADGQSGESPAGLDQPEALTASATVYAVDSAAAQGGQVLLTLVVDAKDAAKVAAYSTQNRLAVIETSTVSPSGGDSVSDSTGSKPSDSPSPTEASTSPGGGS